MYRKFEKYKVTEDNTYYSDETPDELIAILEAARISRTRLKIYLGHKFTGEDWMEENEKYCRIGRSTGAVKIPLFIPRKDSTGGPGLLDSSIVKVVDTKTKQVLYRHPKYHQPLMEIRDSLEKGYTHSVHIKGKLYSNHKSRKSAERLVKKLK